MNKPNFRELLAQLYVEYKKVYPYTNLSKLMETIILALNTKVEVGQSNEWKYAPWNPKCFPYKEEDNESN